MGETINFLVGKVVDLLCGVAIKEIGYMWNCSQNVKNCKSEVEKLSVMKGRVQQQIDLAKSKGEILLEGVEEWMNKADNKLSEAVEFIAEEAEAKKTCFNGVNLSTLRRHSRMATKKNYFLVQHQGDGRDFENHVSIPASTPGFADVYQRKDLEGINTQMWILKKIIEAIKDDTIQIVGITGLGGVGKTTLASEVAKEMKKEFASIVFVQVSQTVDAKVIEEKVQTVTKRIINGDKVLIILDDVWGELKLDEVGIPCGRDYLNCKILLTSRSIDVCEAMNAQKVILVNPLPEEEAWTLFERVVSRSVWDNTMKQLALKIVHECRGLPLFIQTIGMALKNKETRSWEATLRRLQAPTNEDAPFIIKGIMQLKLSYDYIENEVAKSCFLLCSMFPEDGRIDLTKLTYYALGLGIFNNPDCNIESAKDIVQGAVDSLGSSFLLLSDVYRNRKFSKMHDLVRDMALFITSEGNEKSLVLSRKGLTDWQPRKDSIKSYKKISLMKNKIRKLPDYELDCPDLVIFLIQNNELSVLSDEFFRGMKKLQVLDMSANNITFLPQSLKHLTKLRMLDLSGNKSLCEISILGELTYLEILNLRGTGITKISKEIGQLTNLRLLDVYSCKYLSYVASGVISKLIVLEELYVELEKVKSYKFLVELSELKSLKVLHLTLPDLRCIPRDSHFETLMEFDIRESSMNYLSDGCKHKLQFSTCSFPFTIPIMNLIQKSEMLNLLCIKDLDNILPSLYQEGLNELKYIKLKGCENVRSLVKTSDLDALQICVKSNELGQRKTQAKIFSQVERIMLDSLDSLELLWDSQHHFLSFCNLAEIKIINCPSLLKLFLLSVAQGLVNLRSLEVVNCKNLAVLISAGDEQTTGCEIEQTSGSKTEFVKHDTHIVFPPIDIVLYGLPKLESFYSGHSIIRYPHLKHMFVDACPSMKRWSNGDNHIPKLEFDQDINDYIAGRREINENLFIQKSFQSDDLGERKERFFFRHRSNLLRDGRLIKLLFI